MPEAEREMVRNAKSRYLAAALASNYEPRIYAKQLMRGSVHVKELKEKGIYDRDPKSTLDLKEMFKNLNGEC